MPFSRRKPSRRMTRKRRPKTALAKATSALRQVRQIKSATEKHHTDHAFSFPNLDIAGDVLALTNIVQGDGQNERVGLKMFTKNVSIRLVAEDIVNAKDAILYRIMVVQDRRQEGGVIPTIVDVLEQARVDGHLNLGELGRFKVWYDRVFYLAELASGNGPTRRFTKINLPIRVPVRYLGPLVTDIASNGIYLMAVCDDADPGTLNLNGQARIAFTDT